MRLLTALALAFALGGCDRDSGKSAVAEQVRTNALGVVAAYNRHDAHAAAAFDAPDYVGIYHGSANTLGPAADEAGMKAQMAGADVQWRLGEDRVTISKAGDLAVFEAPYTFTINLTGAAPTRESGTWIAIFRSQEDGSMKLWRSIASDTPEAKAEVQ